MFTYEYARKAAQRVFHNRRVLTYWMKGGLHVAVKDYDTNIESVYAVIEIDNGGMQFRRVADERQN